jgi:hypothetical protein
VGPTGLAQQKRPQDIGFEGILGNRQIKFRGICLGIKHATGMVDDAGSRSFDPIMDADVLTGTCRALSTVIDSTA